MVHLEIKECMGFKQIRPTFIGWKAGFFQDITMLMHRVKSSVTDNLVLWLDSLP
jgi:hypothetical protein